MDTSRTLCAAALAASALLASTSAAQSGGFAPGELVLYSPAIQGTGTTDGGIARIDPLTGQTSLVVGLFAAQVQKGCVSYDAFRDRLIFCGGITAPTLPTRVYTLDGSGNARDLGLGARSLFAFAPASAGRVYYGDAASLATAPIKYIDSNDVEHTLLDAAGAQPFTLGVSFRTMLYDAATNALVVASSSGAAQACSMGVTNAVNVRSVPLSSDGTRVLGPVSCAQFVVDPNSSNEPVGISRAPGGQILLVVDTNANTQQPRMVLLDPATLTMTAFASNVHAFAAATNAGTYSSARSEAVILDTGGNILRAFAQGTSGGGATITPSMAISSAGSSGEVATLIEIPIGDCGTNDVALYCTPKTTSGGCVPAISTSGGPSLSAASGFVITAAQIEPQKSGIFFYGRSGRNSAPFQGGTLCVAPPTQRTPVQSSGGAAACGGVLAFDFAAWLAAGSDPMCVAGTLVDGQFWFRDPASASTTGLSAGVEFTMCP